MTNLLEALDRLIGLAEGPERKYFEELKTKLLEEQFQVVVMGEFKRGKSSLINALLGETILPVASIPLTSVVTVVKSGPQTKATVEFLDGRSNEIGPAAIEDYVAEERNPKNRKRVGRVIVEAASSLLGKGTLLVDTPGSGSIYRHNTEAAQEYLPQADAVIIVLSSDPPIGETEVQFLRSVRRWTRKLFVVLNKIDYLAPSDLERSLQFTQRAVDEALGVRVPLFPISAKLALEAKKTGDDEMLERSGFKVFVGALEGFLKEEKRQSLIDSVQARAKNLVDGLLLRIDMDLAGVDVAGERWRSKIETLRRRLTEVKRGQYELSKLYRAEIEDHARVTEESLYAMVRERTRTISRALEERYRSIRSEPGAQVRKALNALFVGEIEDAFSSFLAQEEPRWTQAFQEMTDRYLASTVALVNETRQDTASVFGVEYRALAKPPITVAQPAVWFIVDDVSIWSGGIHSMPTLRIFKAFFWRTMQRKIGEAMDMNAGRLRYDHARRLEQAEQKALDLIQAFFDSSIESLERAITGSKRKAEVVQLAGQTDRFALEARKQLLTAVLGSGGIAAARPD